MPKHIARLIVLIVGLGALALVAKSLLTVDSFHEFGHYRGDSVVQVAAREPVFQTARYCESCHVERLAQWSAHSHRSVTCETCHGPARGHPAAGKLAIPTDTARLCGACHEATAGRPRSQPQVDISPHTIGESCITCHNPHAPKIRAVAAFAAAEPGAAGRRIASCDGCHGAKGVSGNDLWPSLAGQHAEYLTRILGAYKSGDQRDVLMTPIVKDLSDAEVRELATHYARLACGAPAKAKAGDAVAGKSLARSCAACHGETGIAPNPAWPSLAAQKPGYIVHALKAFRAGLRTDPMMAGVARGLSDTDMVNLAAFYSEQACAPIQQARSTP
jgi:cytochrome c553